MDEIESFARVSVARGSGFALLAIVCFMVGLSGMPEAALKSGGIFCLIAAFVLIAKAERAPHRRYKQTEVWLMLDEGRRPPETIAQQVIGGALQAVCRQFALYFAQAAAVALTLSLLVALAA
jgi:hypothetical protein